MVPDLLVRKLFTGFQIKTQKKFTIASFIDMIALISFNFSDCAEDSALQTLFNKQLIQPTHL